MHLRNANRFDLAIKTALQLATGQFDLTTLLAGLGVLAGGEIGETKQDPTTVVDTWSLYRDMFHDIGSFIHLVVNWHGLNIEISNELLSRIT